MKFETCWNILTGKGLKFFNRKSKKTQKTNWTSNKTCTSSQLLCVTLIHTLCWNVNKPLQCLPTKTFPSYAFSSSESFLCMLLIWKDNLLFPYVISLCCSYILICYCNMIFYELYKRNILQTEKKSSFVLFFMKLDKFDQNLIFSILTRWN